MTRTINLSVNGRMVRARVEEKTTLAEFLRDDLGLRGTKVVCGIGECGACTVLKDGVPVSACLELAVRADGAALETIEGLSKEGRLHRLQSAFVENSAFQCGFCTAGMIMMAKPLVERTHGKKLGEREVRNHMSGNLCRCTGYRQIVDAIVQASGPEASEGGS